MIGTIFLLGVIACGYFKLTLLTLFPVTVGATFIGLHYPPGKANALKANGRYWEAFWGSIPFQAIFMLCLFGLGWGISSIVN